MLSALRTEGYEPSASGHGDVQSEAAYVEFRGVDKTYEGRRLAVDGLSMSIARGEFITLLGPSGSGKTTSLMMLAGFEAPTSGEICLRGRSLQHIPPFKRNLGIVFQNYALFPNMTAAENIGFPLSVRKYSREDIRRRVEEALALVRLSEFGGRQTHELSGGQQQRIALARALVFDPDLVLMDEPLGALDRQLRESMQIEIKHIQKKLGITVVYVTHDQSEALTMSDRIAVFNGGKLLQLATPQELYERPATAFVARFIGESNNLEGAVVAQQGEWCTVELLSGRRLRGIRGDAGAVGTAAVVSVRPERIRWGTQAAACENTLNAVVQELIYSGDHTRARLMVEGRDDFILRIPNSMVLPCSVGSRLQIGWDAADGRALAT